LSLEQEIRALETGTAVEEITEGNTCEPERPTSADQKCPPGVRRQERKQSSFSSKQSLKILNFKEKEVIAPTHSNKNRLRTEG
jgi:hypothetical protein